MDRRKLPLVSWETGEVGDDTASEAAASTASVIEESDASTEDTTPPSSPLTLQEHGIKHNLHLVLCVQDETVRIVQATSTPQDGATSTTSRRILDCVPHSQRRKRTSSPPHNTTVLKHPAKRSHNSIQLVPDSSLAHKRLKYHAESNHPTYMVKPMVTKRSHNLISRIPNYTLPFHQRCKRQESVRSGSNDAERKEDCHMVGYDERINPSANAAATRKATSKLRNEPPSKKFRLASISEDDMCDLSRVMLALGIFG